MENEINVAELLKDCPRGMELDCTAYKGIITLDEVTDFESYYPIRIKINNNNRVNYQTLTKYGQTCETLYHECVIFPKGKNSWEGFQRPFKDGDIVCSSTGSIAILKIIPNKVFYSSYCGLFSNFFKTDGNTVAPIRFATEEEKAKLFQSIKDNGYKWNEETKILENLIKPKFKVGNRITNGKVSFIIGHIDSEYYYEIGRNIATRLFIKNQDEWELVPDKFDFNTLKPFDKVLVRCGGAAYWEPQFFSKYEPNIGLPFKCTYNNWAECIPYEANKHLCGTCDDCDDFYKIWQIKK